jgi:ABC-2 type transport system ATP-binding protein
VLVLDEPINGLDPEGIKWIRGFLRELADEGRTVLVSSHLLSEVQQSVDEVVIIAKGELVHRGTLSSLDTSAVTVLVDAPDRASLASALVAARLAFTNVSDGYLVSGAESSEVGHVAFVAGVELSTLQRQRSGLEESFLALVGAGDSL